MPLADIVPDHYTISTFINGTVNSQNPEEVEEMVQFCLKANSKSVNIVVFNSLIHGYAKAKNVERAVKVYEMIKNLSSKYYITPDKCTFETMLDACAASANCEMALKLWKEFELVYNWKPTSHACNSLLLAFARGEQQLEKVETMYQFLVNEKMPIDAKTHAIVMDCYVKYNKFAMATQLFYKNIDKLEIDSVNALIKGLLKQDKVKIAMNLLSTVTEQNSKLKPDVYTFTSILGQLAFRGRVEMAEKVLNQMMQLNIKPNDVTMATMLNTYIRAHDINKAEHFFMNMRNAPYHVEPGINSYNTMLKGLFASDRVGDASRILEEMEKKQLQFTEVTFVTAIRGFLAKNKVKEAEKVATKVEQFKYRLNMQNNYLRETLTALKAKINEVYCAKELELIQKCKE